MESSSAGPSTPVWPSYAEARCGLRTRAHSGYSRPNRIQMRRRDCSSRVVVHDVVRTRRNRISTVPTVQNREVDDIEARSVQVSLSIRHDRFRMRKDPSMTYLALWAQHYDGGVIEITNPSTRWPRISARAAVAFSSGSSRRTLPFLGSPGSRSMSRDETSGMAVSRSQVNPAASSGPMSAAKDGSFSLETPRRCDHDWPPGLPRPSPGRTCPVPDGADRAPAESA